MKGKVALVTGARGGLGTYVTQALLDAGATVIGLSRKIEQSEFNSTNFTALPAEISTADGAKRAVDSLVSRFGRLDILVHTVGGFAGGKPVAETDDATFERMFDVNLYSTFFLLRAAIPVMRKTGNGRSLPSAVAQRWSPELAWAHTVRPRRPWSHSSGRWRRKTRTQQLRPM